MAAVGPFERHPRLAVAVSGGPDSLALCLLAADWARRRRADLRALIVDHRLRRGSGAEARRVGAWLAARNIPHRILTRRGPAPVSGIQAAARDARYRLLGAHCRHHGIFHLLLGHHLDDQAETLLLRLARGSGVDGLAAMSKITETPDVRLLRPLLPVSKSVLRETLRRRRQPWIEDPTNRDPGHLRVRVRDEAPRLSALGMTAPRLAATATRMGAARVALEDATGDLLANAVVLHPAGYAYLDPARVAAAPAEAGRRALARLLTTVGGSDHGPRGARLAAAHRDLAAGVLTRPRTLGGCRLVPQRTGALLVCREPAAATERIDLDGRRKVIWDGRFGLAFGARGPTTGGLAVARLGRHGWAQVVADRPEIRLLGVPFPALPALPAIFDDSGVVAVPHLGYGRQGIGPARLLLSKIDYLPRRPLFAARFCLAL
jgi:tRNA(Ile)-lysidine synthase